MLFVVPLAFCRAGVADPRAELEYLAKHLLVGSGSPDGQLASRFAHVGAVETGADALPHVHLLSRAGVGAAQTHARAIHEVVRRIPKRLVDVSLDVGVKRNHFADGHGILPLWRPTGPAT